MKSIWIFLIALSTFNFANAQNGTRSEVSGDAALTIVLENVRNDQGAILVGLHSAQTFMKSAGLDGFKKEAAEGEMVFTFEGVEPGRYAVIVLHDQNANGRMDYETSGLPKEPYALSGNDRKMGPPTFESAAFEMASEDLELHLRF